MLCNQRILDGSLGAVVGESDCLGGVGVVRTVRKRKTKAKRTLLGPLVLSECEALTISNSS